MCAFGGKLHFGLASECRLSLRFFGPSQATPVGALSARSCRSANAPSAHWRHGRWRSMRSILAGGAAVSCWEEGTDGRQEGLGCGDCLVGRPKRSPCPKTFPRRVPLRDLRPVSAARLNARLRSSISLSPLGPPIRRGRGAPARLVVKRAVKSNCERQAADRLNRRRPLDFDVVAEAIKHKPIYYIIILC